VDVVVGTIESTARNPGWDLLDDGQHLWNS
jgi:hypothetical protein